MEDSLILINDRSLGFPNQYGKEQEISNVQIVNFGGLQRIEALFNAGGSYRF